MKILGFLTGMRKNVDIPMTRIRTGDGLGHSVNLSEPCGGKGCIGADSRFACIVFCVVFGMGLFAASCDRPDNFDSGDVYIFGTLLEGACGHGAVAHWGDPNTPLVGFDCYVDEGSAIVKPGEGRLVYRNVFEDHIREFHCDGCPDWTPEDPYPESVLSNDTILPSPPCDPGMGGGLLFMMSPGGVIH